MLYWFYLKSFFNPPAPPYGPPYQGGKFPIVYGLFLFSLFFSLLSCTNNSTHKGRFPDNFQQGSDEDLYNITELLGDNPVLESEEVFFAIDDSSTATTNSDSRGTVSNNSENTNSSDTKNTNRNNSRPASANASGGATLTPLTPLIRGEPELATNLEYPALSSRGGYPKEILNPDKLSKLLQIKTASPKEQDREKATVSFAQDNIRIDPSISFINKYEFLDYTLLNADTSTWNRYIARLVGQVERFKGFPDSIYYILPLFEGRHLVLYKLAPEDKLPYDELPLAKRLGNLLAVPFIGYPIQYCVPRVIPDINNRLTGQVIPHCDGVPLKGAKYIKLQEEDKKIFAYQKKWDLFPRDFFTLKAEEHSNWFYVQTVAKGPEDRFVGHQPFEPARLVEFHPSSDAEGETLEIQDASGYDIDPQNRSEANLSIPIEWVDFQIKKDSEIWNRSFGEELKKETKNTNPRYFKIQFNKLIKNQVQYAGEKTLKDVFITDNYFSFNVEVINDSISGSRKAYLIKYAFYKKPINASYVPKRWFKEDSTKFFPTFTEERKSHEEHLGDLDNEDHDQLLRVTRFDPKAKEIRWYFSKQSPRYQEAPWIRELGHLAVQVLNQAFAKAGKDSAHKINIVLDETEDKEVGDIRYNILNIMLTKGQTTSGLLGLGPNVANPITGEVVSATANIWANEVLEIYTEVVKQYIRFQVYKPAWALQPWTENLKGFFETKLYTKDTKQCVDNLFEPLGVTPFMHEKIQRICPEVTDFIDKHKGITYSPNNPDLQDKEVMASCSKKLSFIPLLAITLHEMLHGFGQRHIFSASVDSQNFYKDYQEITQIFGKLVPNKIKELFAQEGLLNKELEETAYMESVKCHKHPPQYSSVMDYMNLYNPVLFVPGKLDIAALRFIYFDRVDLTNSEVLEIPAGADTDPQNPQKSIEETAQLKNKENLLKPFRVLCGGNKIEGKEYRETHPNKPLCRKFDYGKNPLEIVVNHILSFNNFSLVNGRHRYDSNVAKTNIDGAFLNSINEGVGSLYNKWESKRDHLLNQKGERGKKIIENYSFLNEEDINTYQNRILEESHKNPEFKSYYDIREPVFNYLKRLTFMPFKHCIYKKGIGFQAVSFQKIVDSAQSDYKEYSENTREEIMDCQSPVAENWRIKNNKGELIAEVGFLTGKDSKGTEIRYFVRPKMFRDNTHEISPFIIWKYLMSSTNENWDKDKNKLFHFSSPLFSPWLKLVQEPDFGKKYYNTVLTYTLEGTNVRPYIHRDFIDPNLIQQYPNLVSKLKDPEYLKPALSYKEDQDSSLFFLKPKKVSLRIYNQGTSSYTGGEDVAKFIDQDIFTKHLSILQLAFEKLKRYNPHQALFEKTLGWDLRRLTSISNSIDSIDSNSDYPFFEQVYEEFQQQNSSNSLADFIKNHPASLYDNLSPEGIVIPYTDDEANLPSLLFRRVEEFKTCLETLGDSLCPDAKDKRAYIKSVLNYYYEEMVN